MVSTCGDDEDMFGSIFNDERDQVSKYLHDYV